jgi:hypothetical protein
LGELKAPLRLCVFVATFIVLRIEKMRSCSYAIARS